MAERTISAWGWTYRFVVEKSLCPAKYARVYGSMYAAHLVRQVCRRVYRLNGSSLARAIALRCCFRRLDFSMWPVRVGAGNTHSSECAPRLMDNRAPARCVRGIRLRAFSVFPNGM